MFDLCIIQREEAHCASNIVINLSIPKMWLSKIWPWKYKVKVMGEVKVLSHNLGPTFYQIVLEIPTDQPVRGGQLWRRTGYFLLIFLQFNQGSHTGQHKKFPEFSLSFPWDIWKFQSYFEPFIQISKGNSLPKEVSWRNIHEKFCYSNESYGLLTPLTASLSSTFWLTASFKCSLHIYQVIHKWLFDCNLKNRGLHWMTTMFCMSPMLKWTWA